MLEEQDGGDLKSNKKGEYRLSHLLPIRGLMFDMDNTVLCSSIDFPAMKEGVYSYLSGHRLLPDLPAWQQYTSAQLIEMARERAGDGGQWLDGVWDVIGRFEREGMAGAGLEPEVHEVLDRLYGRYPMVILTNNTYPAALAALTETGVKSYFDHIVGREQMGRLKPSPDGVLYVHKLYPDIAAEEWVVVGDSWMDGKAASDGGSRFILYGCDTAGLETNEVPFIAQISKMSELLEHL